MHLNGPDICQQWTLITVSPKELVRQRVSKFFFLRTKKNPKLILQRLFMLSRKVIVFDFSKPQQKLPNDKYATDEAS